MDPQQDSKDQPQNTFRRWRGYTDIRAGHWILKLSPVSWRPYLRLARLDRPIGTWLLLWPGLWSIALASGDLPDPFLILCFGIGALVMRGSGCVWNDIVDRDIDGRVERTAGRPIPAGEVSVPNAIIFMVLLAAIGLTILLTFNGFAIIVGIAALLPVVIYPFMKRITWWPQFFLGLAFNWGALLGWAAVEGSLSLAPILLYCAGIAWTLGYDTIYAMQDQEDDALIGVKSSARRLGDSAKTWLFIFYLLALSGFVGSAWIAKPSFWLIPMAALAGGQLLWQVATLDPKDQGDCLTKFKSNTWFGWILFAGFMLA